MKWAKKEELSVEVRNLIITTYNVKRNFRNSSIYCKSIIKKLEQHYDVKNRPGRGRKSLFTVKDITNFIESLKKTEGKISKIKTGIVNENRYHQFCTKNVERKIRKLGYVRRVA